MKLLIENIENFDVELITEENSLGVKDVFIKGVFMQADRLNRNGRIYPEHILDKEVNRYIAEKVLTDRAVGELDHPISGPQITLDRISHKIISLEKQGKDYVGKAKLLSTPTGNIAKNLIAGGVKLGVSSRALGKVDSNGIVSEKFLLITPADIVSDPSCYDALVDAVMENKEWVLNQDGNWVEKFVDQAQTVIRKSSKADLQQNAINIFETFLKNISQTYKN